MKKLNKVLFGFGSVAAVVAPVAAVVACGDEGTKKTDIKLSVAQDVINFAKDKGYTISEAIAKEILAKIGVDATITNVLPGLLNDDSHGSNDFAVVIKGKGSQTRTAFNSTDAIVANPATAEYSLFTNKGFGTTSDKSLSTLATRWGLTNEIAKDATAILYFQSYASTATAEYVEVLRTKDNKIVTHDGSAAKDWTIVKA